MIYGKWLSSIVELCKELRQKILMTIHQDALDIRCLSRIGFDLIWPALTESLYYLMMTGDDPQFRLTI